MARWGGRSGFTGDLASNDAVAFVAEMGRKKFCCFFVVSKQTRLSLFAHK